MLVGELSLDGTLRPVRGALSIAVCARRQGIPNLLVPADNAAEAAVTEGVRVFGMRHLAEVVTYLNQPDRFQPTPSVAPSAAFSGRTAARFSRSPRPNHRQARARSGGRRRPQRADDRPARFRQNDAGETIRRHPAAADVSGIHRDHADPQRRGTASARRRDCWLAGRFARRTTPYRTRA